jgi:hypothetical protein
MARMLRTAAQQWVAAALVFSTLLYGTLCAAIFPFLVYPPMLCHAATWRDIAKGAITRPVSRNPEEGVAPFLATVLPRGTRILTENAGAHSMVTLAGDEYDLVPVWSPEVAFLFDRSLGIREQRRRLREHRITAVLVYTASANTVFCMLNSPFYAQDFGNWKDVGHFKTLFEVCQVPFPNEPIANDPAEAHINQGSAWMQFDRVPEAMLQFEEALQLNPDSVEAHYNLGGTLIRTGRMAEAMHQYEETLRLNPEIAEAHNNLGVLLAQAGRWAEAKGHYEAALRIKPDFAEVSENLVKLQILSQSSSPKK